MSTIRHPVQNHAWWYAAAAALATALLVVLMVTVLGGSGTSDTTPPAPPADVIGHGGHAYAPPCFAGHPVSSIELARSGCLAVTP
jgi:hypothetical protein